MGAPSDLAQRSEAKSLLLGPRSILQDPHCDLRASSTGSSAALKKGPELSSPRSDSRLQYSKGPRRQGMTPLWTFSLHQVGVSHCSHSTPAKNPPPRDFAPREVSRPKVPSLPRALTGHSSEFGACKSSPLWPSPSRASCPQSTRPAGSHRLWSKQHRTDDTARRSRKNSRSVSHRKLQWK